MRHPDSATCKLSAGATCSPQFACCDAQCNIVRRCEGRICRHASGECSLSRYCDGVSAECGRTVFKPSGSACGIDEAGACHASQCFDTESDEEFTPHNEHDETDVEPDDIYDDCDEDPETSLRWLGVREGIAGSCGDVQCLFG